MMKIFVCEQDPFKAKLMQDILSVYKYKVVTVSDRGDLFEQSHHIKPAIIVINEAFAQTSGPEMLNSLRQNPETANIPVIFIRDNEPLEQQLSQYQFDGLTEIVREPIKIKNLRHYIDRWTTFRSLYVKH